MGYGPPLLRQPKPLAGIPGDYYFINYLYNLCCFDDDFYFKYFYKNPSNFKYYNYINNNYFNLLFLEQLIMLKYIKNLFMLGIKK